MADESINEAGDIFDNHVISKYWKRHSIAVLSEILKNLIQKNWYMHFTEFFKSCFTVCNIFLPAIYKNELFTK